MQKQVYVLIGVYSSIMFPKIIFGIKSTTRELWDHREKEKWLSNYFRIIKTEVAY